MNIMKIWARLVAALLAIAAPQAWAGPPPGVPFTGKGLQPFSFRANMGVLGSANPMDGDAPFPAYGDARKMFGGFVSAKSGTNPTVGLPAVYGSRTLGTWTCANGTAALTLTLPTASLPTRIQSGPTQAKLVVNGCGASGAALNATVLSISGNNPYTVTVSSGTLPACTSCPTAALEPFMFYPQALPGNTTILTNFMQHTTVDQWVYDTGTLVTTQAAAGLPAFGTLTMPNDTFNPNADLSIHDTSGAQQTYVEVDDPTGACASYYGQIANSPSFTTAELVPAPGTTNGSPQIGSSGCTSSTTSLIVWWGFLLFPPDAVTGHAAAGVAWQCEFPGIGASGAPAIVPIQTYYDPFDVQITGSVTTAQDSMAGSAQCGTDDQANLAAVLNYANHPTLGLGYRTLVIKAPNANTAKTNPSYSGNFFVSSITNILPNLTMGICADAPQFQIYWPTAAKLLKNATVCDTPRPLPPPPHTLDPNTHFRHSQTVTGRPLIFVAIGDSLFNNASNGLGGVGSACSIISMQFGKMLGKQIDHYCRNIGGTTANQFDPYGMTTGLGAGFPTSSQVASANWWTNTLLPWISYAVNPTGVSTVCGDIYFAEWQNDQGGWSPHVLKDINGALIARVQAACGFTPDIIWGTGPGQSAVFNGLAQEQSDNYMAGNIRSLVLANDALPYWQGEDTPYHQVGLFDYELQSNKEMFGFDAYNPPMLVASDISPRSSLQGDNQNLSIPMTWPRPVRAFSLATGLKTTQGNKTSSYFFNTFLGGGLDIPTGNGTYGSPYLVGTSAQTFALTQGFPNNMLQMSRDATTGNIAFTGYEFFVSETATCGMTSYTLTCTTGVYNFGYIDATIAIQGAGSSACPPDIGGTNCLVTHIAPQTTGTLNGKVVICANAGTLASGTSTAIDIYQTYPTPANGTAASGQVGNTPNGATPPAYVTQIPAVSLMNNGGDGSPSCGFCGFTNGIYFQVEPPFAEVVASQTLNGLQLYSGSVVSYGGTFSPVIQAGWNGATTVSNITMEPLPGGSTEDADDMVSYTPTFPDSSAIWCSPPGYSCPQGGGASTHPANLFMQTTLAALFGSEDIFATTPAGEDETTTVANLLNAASYPCSATVNVNRHVTVTDIVTYTANGAISGSGGGSISAMAICQASGAWTMH